MQPLKVATCNTAVCHKYIAAGDDHKALLMIIIIKLKKIEQKKKKIIIDDYSQALNKKKKLLTVNCNRKIKNIIITKIIRRNKFILHDFT